MFTFCQQKGTRNGAEKGKKLLKPKTAPLSSMTRKGLERLITPLILVFRIPSFLNQAS
jgi:hypothetical protein